MMRKQYLLKGLTCNNCATKIESAISKLEYIKNVSINMVNITLIVDFENINEIELDKKIIEIVKKYESDVVVTTKDNSQSENKERETNYQLFFLIIGLILFVCAMFLNIEEQTRFIILLLSYLVLGWSVLLKAIKNIFTGQLLDENFLMSIATIGAFIINQAPEAVAVMLFYQIGESFQKMAINKSRKSITDLMDIRPDYANIEKDNKLVQVDPFDLAINDIIIVKPGEKIPLDGIIIEGKSMIDTKALTGESTLRSYNINDIVISGCINKTGVLKIKVTKTFNESTVSKIIDLVENSASNKAPTENFITTFSKFYTPIVVGLAILIAFVFPLILNDDWSKWINRGLIFLVISCPCALVVSIPLGFFGGVGAASKHGILVKGSNYLEALSKLDTVVFDKTGTLTKGVFKVVAINEQVPFTKEQLIELAAKAEYFSDHPIAVSIKNQYNKELTKAGLDNYVDINGLGISVEIDNKQVLVGNDKLMIENNVTFLKSNEIGTVVYLALDGQFMGSIVIADEIKDDSIKTIKLLKQSGVSTIVMLTGDNKEIAEGVGKKLEVDYVLSQLLPQDKVNEVEYLLEKKDKNKKLAFVGDGINDAPVLARADVGIAMGGLGSDAAVEAADVVLMNDKPSKIIEAINISKFTKKIVWQNIIFALGIKAIFLIMGAFGVATMWEAVFADVGVTLLAVINAMRIIQKRNF